MNRASRILACGLALLAFPVLADPAPRAAAGDPPKIEGWTIAKGAAANVCAASGPTDGGANLSLVAEGPLFVLAIQAPDFPYEKASYVVNLAFDSDTPLDAPGLGDKGLITVSVGRGQSARIVAKASAVTVTVAGQSHHFSIRNAGQALDAVARCIGQPTLSETVEEPSTPIAGAGDWRLQTNLPGAPHVCSARVAGPQIDTILLLNDDGEIVLIGSHSDWATFGGDTSLRLAIDGAEPLELKSSSALNLITTRITDPALVDRLRQAKTLTWGIRGGHVHGDVTGLGAALDAIKRCRQASRSG
jgi:hypothetical protein